MVFILSLFLPYLPSPWAVRYFSSSLTVSCCNDPFRDMSSQSYSLYVFRSRLLLSVCLWVDVMDSLSLSVVRCSRHERTYFSSTANFVAYSLMASVSLRVISDKLKKRFNWALGCSHQDLCGYHHHFSLAYKTRSYSVEGSWGQVWVEVFAHSPVLPMDGFHRSRKDDHLNVHCTPSWETPNRAHPHCNVIQWMPMKLFQCYTIMDVVLMHLLFKSFCQNAD